VKQDDIRKLLGGYATGTLTDAERKALFDAALEDQSLFDAIAEDGALKEVLDDPQARAYLLEALPAKPTLVVKRIPAWSWAAAGSVAATLVIGVLLVRTPGPQKITTLRAIDSLQPMSELEAHAADKREPGPPVAKQKALAPAVVLSNRVQAETSQSANTAAPLQESDREARSGAETDAKQPAEKESVAPVAVAENRQKVEVSPAADAVRPPAALAGRPVESTALSTATGEQLPLLDSAVQTQQSARQLFYSPVYSAGAAAELFTGRRDAPAKAKRAATQPAGTPGLRYTLLRRQPDGSYLETDPSTIFHAGDAIRLSVETNAPGYLAVWNGRAALANLSVLARTKYTIPAEGAIDLDGPPGDRKLQVIFSRAVQAKPAGLVGGLLVEQSTERATYVADPRPSSLVSFEINLVYR